MKPGFYWARLKGDPGAGYEPIKVDEDGNVWLMVPFEENDRLKAALHKLEWCIGDGIHKRCPVCRGISPDTMHPKDDPRGIGHINDCWLDQLLENRH